jgi:hypothetical protein
MVIWKYGIQATANRPKLADIRALPNSPPLCRAGDEDLN